MKSDSSRLTRREFLAALALSVAARPLCAQLPALTRIAWISNDQDSRSSLSFEAFRDGMRELGYVEGRNLIIDARWGATSSEDLEKFAFGLAAANPQVIVTTGSAAILVVKRINARMPVVFGYSGDPTEIGIVDSLVRPGRNFTGISLFARELVNKRLELLKQVVPSIKRIAIVANPDHPGLNAELRASKAAAEALGFAVSYYIVRSATALEGVFTAIPGTRSEAIVVFPDADLMRYSKRFAQFAQTSRIPSISAWAPFAESGNLMTYGPNLRMSYRRMASYVDRIIKGAQPAELPVELPTSTEWVVNLYAAQSLGIAISPDLLRRADRVIR